MVHCVEIVQIRSFLWSAFRLYTGKYGPRKTPYLDTFHAVVVNPLTFIHFPKKRLIVLEKKVFLLTFEQDYFGLFRI